MKFTVKDFPIGSTAYFYKMVEVQVNPRARLVGEKRFTKQIAFSRFTVTRHLSGLVASEYCDIDCGYDVTNSRFESEGFLIIPDFLYQDIHNRSKIRKLTPAQELFLLLRDPECNNHKINEIVLNSKLELSKPWYNKIFFKDLKKVYYP